VLQSHRRAQARIAAGLFAGLGVQVGAWAVLIPELVASRDLTTAELGAALAVMAATSIGALAAAGPLADRIGRRPLAVAGAAGFAGAFALLAAVEAPLALWPTLALYGVASGCLDLAANAVGSDYERAHDVRAMVRLHAGFSAAAACGALLAGVAGQDMYAIVAGLYVALAAATIVAPLPPHEEAEPFVGAPHETAVAAAHEATEHESAVAAAHDSSGPAGRESSGVRAAHESTARAGRLDVLRIPGVAVAVGLVTVCFFGDGAIEGYAALFLRDALGSGALLTGVALAAFHTASMAGRLVFSRATDDRRVLTVSGLLASAAMAVVVAANAAGLAAAGLLVVGFALAPIVPTALSLAGRSAPGRSATAVSVVTTVGYSAFVLGPPLVGLLASATSLRAALIPVVASTASIALLARYSGVTCTVSASAPPRPAPPLSASPDPPRDATGRRARTAARGPRPPRGARRHRPSR
jgi:MFS family permease